MPCGADFHCNNLQWKSIADPVMQIGKVVGGAYLFFCVTHDIGGYSFLVTECWL